MATNKDFIVKNGLSVGEDISVSGSVTSNLQFDDTIQAQFGTDSDAYVTHSGTEFQINNSTGQLDLRSVSRILLTASGSETMITATAGGSVILSNSGNPKLETTSTGVDITGNAVLTGELRGPASFVIDPAAVGDNTGGVVIKGDLTVEGTTTTVNSTTLDVADKNITLSVGSPNSAGSDGAGITVDNGSDTDAEIKYSGTNDAWEFNKDVGIGTNNPGSPLQVESATDYLANFKSSDTTAGVKLTDSQSQGRILTANGHLVLVADANNAVGSSSVRFNLDTTSIAAVDSSMILTNTGLGIGVASPSEALDVSGNIQATGTITGSDFSGITMGGSLSGSHDDAKVQYGTTFTGTPAQGHFFFDSLNQKLKVYTGSAFVDAVPAGGGGGGGGGSSDATATFRKYTYTLTGTTNAISGKEDDEVTTGDFISGRLYEITAVGDTDFTAIGASSNAIGVQFTATDVGGGSTGKAKEVLFYATGGTQNIEVYVNGVKAVEGASNDYVATTGTSVTFTSNLSSGDVVDVQVYELLTQDSFYLKSETYTQAQTIAGFVAKSGDTMTGNLNVGSSGANALFTAYGGATARPTFVHASGYGGLQLAGTGASSGSSLIFSNNHTNGLIEEWSIFHDGATDDLVFISGDPADVATLEKMRLTEDGKLGIGTNDPDQPLHVKGTRPIRIERAGVGEFEISIDNTVTGDSLDYVIEPVSGSVSAGFQVRTRQTDGTLLSSLSVNHDGKVGIGTIGPVGNLHIVGGDGVNGSSTIGSASNEFIIENNSAAGMTIRSGADADGVIGFADPDDHNVGQIYYSHDTDKMSIVTNDAVRMTVDSAGTVDVVNDVLTNNAKLKAIAKDISDTAVDVFVYDTRKDSDGGAWRKRTQHTSWYNEALNTSTRGARKEFPCVAVIVVESNQLTIYDGDDPDMPMWMVSGLEAMAADKAKATKKSKKKEEPEEDFIDDDIPF